MAVVHRASTASVLLVAGALAQEPTRSKPPVQPERLVKLLELDDQRGKAGMELWRLGKDAVPALVRALGDPRDEIVEAACAVLAEIGPEAAAAVPDLERLLASAKGRRQRALRWALHGANATGFAIAEWSRGQIVLLDSKGKLSGTIQAQNGLWDVQPLPEGRFLITEVGTMKVRELDAKGNEVWHQDAPGAMSAQRLPSGNTLVACFDGQGVLEFDAAGTVVWEHKNVRCTWARRLLDGHTLMLDQVKHALLEVDAKGDEVRTLEVGDSVFGAQRLPNGNTLIAARDKSSVRELDPAGHEVASFSELTGANACLRLGDGTTIVGGQNDVTALDAAGKLLWRYACRWAGSVRR
jgi:hypothetical protein